ncbi:MarR family winged helix-turn-helix transcriptional regulator [Aliikangiella sp. G2MR2-5]|uniref:MarR family winged helix-turn-helix transcriptional regulator n=1 Tax=Aliikangiella sp. G2MR2-5 TaxID=2788943 RepID=UPI0018A9EF3B|nr:MarR family transcriptional regulator [Aliikangiella sp. G2MR2-5]
MQRGLGTQLRHIIELLDGAVTQSYVAIGLEYRPRYTPIMKALIRLESCTVNELANYAGITQPAATQTVKLMLKDQLITTNKDEKDNRKIIIKLSPQGLKIIPELERCWQATKKAEASLNLELGFDFGENLSHVISALSNRSFAERIEQAKIDQSQLSI